MADAAVATRFGLANPSGIHTMIVFGSRMYFTKNVVKTYQLCPHCGNYAACRSYDARKFGHLYFIPLIPEGGRVRVFKECSKCKMGSHVPIGEAEKLYGRVEALLPNCLEAVGENRREFAAPDSNETYNTGSAASEIIDILLTTGHSEDVPGVIELLRNEGAAYETAVAESALADANGQPDQAHARMREAHESAPDELFALMTLADFERRAGDAESELRCLNLAQEIAGEPDPLIMLNTLHPLEKLGRFDELVKTIDQAIELAPQLTQDKNLMKLRKKYAKKARKMATAV